MILAFTGHRPPKIGGYNHDAPLRKAVKAAIYAELTRLAPDGVISGLALGVDQDGAVIAHDMGIPFIGVAPCLKQDSEWPISAQQQYEEICNKADSWLLTQILELYPSREGSRSLEWPGVFYTRYMPYSNGCMQVRNIWMTDRADVILAVWDGSSGGTSNCVRYAQELGKEIIQINPSELL